MKKSLILILVIVIAFALVIPVAAKGKGPGGNGPNISGGTNGSQTAPFQIQQGFRQMKQEPLQMQQGPRQTFAIVGMIVAIEDGDIMTLTIQVLKGNKLVQGSIGDLITVLVVDDLVKTGTPATLIPFEDLEVGDVVSLNGFFIDDTWTAYRVTVDPDLALIHKR